MNDWKCPHCEKSCTAQMKRRIKRRLYVSYCSKSFINPFYSSKDSEYRYKLSFVKISGGCLYEYLKDISIVGRVDENGEFKVFGCKNEDQDIFYQGILDYDRMAQVNGFESVEEVKEWWENEADMILTVEKGCYEVLESE